MARTILIPTDLSVNSLKTLKFALNESPSSGLDIILLFAHVPSNGIGDLLFFSPSKTLRALRTQAFNDALEVLRNRYEHKVGSLRIELFQGRTNGAFKDFARVHGVDEVHLPEPHVRLEHPHGFDPIPQIMASSLPKHVHRWEPAAMQVHEDQLQVLFNR